MTAIVGTKLQTAACLLDFGGWRNDTLQRVLSFIESNYSKPVKLKDVAEIANFSPAYVWAKSEDGTLVYANRRWYEYTGLSSEQSAGWGWLAAVHPDDCNRCLTRWSIARSMGTATDVHDEEVPIS